MHEAGAGTSEATKNGLLAFRMLRITRIVGQVGAVVLVVGAWSASTADGVLYILIGAAMVLVYLAARYRDRRAIHEDRVFARARARQLEHGTLPEAVPDGLGRVGIALEPGETCHVADADVEVVHWYGDPVVLTRPVFFLWGSPLAWFATGMGFFINHRRNRKKLKRAAPRWRDPERACLWLTDRRFVLCDRRGHNRAQVRWASIRHASLQRDGIVLLLDGQSNRPMRIRTSAAASLFVVFWYSTHGRAIYQL